MATSLDQIIDSVLKRDGKGDSGNTLIVANHLSQMKLFGIRQGVELYPDQDDDYDTRKKFIETIWKNNQLELYLDRMWDLFLCKGQFLLYLRPTKDGSYKVYFYGKEQFKPYYNGEGELTEVVIRYSYKERTKFDGAHQQKWLKLKITSEWIEQTECDTQPGFDENLNSYKTKRFENTLKFVPCVVCKNNPLGQGQEGVGEFDWLRNQIEGHDMMTESMNENLLFFGSPTLVSTRSPNELSEMIEGGTENLNRRNTMASANGWWGDYTGSQNKSDPSIGRGMGAQMRIKKVIGHVQNDERFGYIAPDPVSPDHTQHLRESRESIHFALGGIDELGINASATAYEMKTVFGKIAATAGKKARAIYDYGLCKLMEMAIAAEEDLFKQSVANALGKDPAEVNDAFIQDLMEQGKIPPNTFGLPPTGSRLIRWRWTGPVFEDSPRDRLDKSIVARNFQELGVRSLEALKSVFQDKTEKELEGMLSGGYPFRYISSVTGAAQQMLGLYQQMLGVPNPDNPAQPLAFAMPPTPLIQRSLESLFTELNYARTLDPISPGDLPSYHTGASAYNAYLNPSLPGSSTQLLPSGAGSPNLLSGIPEYPSPLSAAGILPFPVPVGEPGYQPVEGSVPIGGVIPEYAVGIATPGSTVSVQQASAIQPQQSLFSGGLPPGAPIPSDLAVNAGQPGSIWQQLFPTLSAAANKLQRKPKRKK